MQVTASSNNIYTSNINKASQTKEVNQKDDKGILNAEELMDKEGYAFLDKLVAGESEKDKNAIKLVFSFQLSIKSNDYIDGKLVIKRETGKLDPQTILSKLDLLSKNKDRRGYLADKIHKIVIQLKAFYTNKTQTSTIIQDKKNSVVDNFIENLYSKNSIESTSTFIKNDMQNKLNGYAKILTENISDTKKSEMLNDYKQGQLKAYKGILESINDEVPSLKQQGIMKALLDKNNEGISSLETLLSKM